jgi:DNA-binding NarL/FixJ family response regulator
MSVPRICCLASIEPASVAALSAAVAHVARANAPAPILSRIDVVELAHLAPDLLVADVDRLDVDPLEMLRRLRFVLPNCIIAIYTSAVDASWSKACHLAGANCLLSKDSNDSELMTGLQSAIRIGCFTDPRFDQRLARDG